MATTQPPVPAPPTKRYHVVFVPGFVGFDVLGQILYYAGVTEVFGRWRAQPGPSKPETSIHYFDNNPTGSVRLRAKRLIKYLATRTARGEFARGDSVALVGHSTGGLDIRLALYAIAEEVAAAPPGSRPPGIVIDGPTIVPYADLLALVDRIVFVSVPHYGTNIADFAARFAQPIQSLAKDAAGGLALNHGALGRLRSKLFALFEHDRSDLVQAIRDALDESDDDPRNSPEEQAKELEARFELTAWLENMASDFSSILDLRSQTAARRDDEARSSSGPRSPAHFGPAARAREIAHWRTHLIRVHSFATRVPPARYASPAWAKRLVAAASAIAPVVGIGTWLRRHVVTAIPGLSGIDALAQATGVPVAFVVLGQLPSAVFDVVYAACANPRGPFRHPDSIDPASIASAVRPFGSGATVPTASAIRVADSDGIVNTLSMLWPFDPAVAPDPIDLVDADHGDVIGHFVLRKHDAAATDGRGHDSYDIFQSSFKLTPQAFAAVWSAAFDFCIRP